MASRLVVVLYGPKAVGKSFIAQALESALGIHYLDLDACVLGWMARGMTPDPELGWLRPTLAAIPEALSGHQRLSVEATGVWDSDWQLADELAAAHLTLLRVWVWAPKAETLARLRERIGRKVPVTAAEAARIYDVACTNPENGLFDLRVDTSGQPRIQQTIDTVRGLLDHLNNSEANATRSSS